MPTQDIRYDEHFPDVMRVLTSRGLLLNSRDSNGKANSMVIGWGSIGSIWGKPIWTVLVRPSRYTYDLIEKTGDFTVSVPGPDLEGACKICGSQSGRDRDKLLEAGLTAAPARQVQSPVIDECIIHYECQVVHKHDLDPGAIVPTILSGSYPSGDFHRVYYGQIVASYADVDRLNELKA